jgi:hypothetical protein
MPGSRLDALRADDAIAQELADLDDARAAVAAIRVARVPPHQHLSRIWSIVPPRSRLALWCQWLGFSKAEVAAAQFRAPIRVAADVAHAIRKLAPNMPSALGVALAVLESCGIVLDGDSLAILCTFAAQCRFPRPVS